MENHKNKKINIVSRCIASTFFILIFSFCISLSPAHASTIAVPANFLSLNSGLVGYWTFDGKDVVNGVARDKSGNGNNGNLINIATSTFYAPGKIGQGFNFDGNNDNVTASTISGVAVASLYSASLWMYTSSTTQNTTGLLEVVNGASDRPIVLVYNAGDIRSGSYDGVSFYGKSGSVSASKWHHVVLVHTSPTTNNLFIDGVLQAGTTPGSASVNVGLKIGNNNSKFFQGNIDDVRIYNRALSAQEVAQLYNIGAATKVDTSRTASSSPLTSGLVGYWTMDGKDVVNGVALDKSGNGNNGNLISIATSTFYVPGKIGQGFSFDGVNDRVNVTQSTSINNLLPATYSLWMYPKTVTQNTFLAKGGSFVIYISNPGTIRVEDIYYPTQKLQRLSVSNTIVANKWQQIVVTRDNTGTADGLRFYINGLEVTYTTSGKQDGLGIRNTDAGSNLIVGASGGGSFFPGLIDDVRIYNRALSAQEVAQLYSLGAATKIDVSPTASSSPLMGNGLVGYWTFDGKDVVNGVARDKSGQGNNTNFINIATSTFYAPGKIGQGIRCDGVNDYTSATDSTSLRLSNRFTISNWLKLDSTTQASYIQTKRNAQDEYAVVYGYVAGKYEFYAEGYSGGVPRTPLTTSVTDKKWHHVVWTYDGTRLRGYLDGNLDVTATITFTLLQTTGALRYCTSTGGTDFFRGYIDDPRIYNRQLSDQEVKALYGLGR